METYEVLEKALDEIRDERNWGQGPDTWNIGCDGPVCAEGALLRVLDIDRVSELRDAAAYELLMRLSGKDELFKFNDHATHAEVVALFQRAIREEKRKAGIPVDLSEADDEKTEDRSPVEATL